MLFHVSFFWGIKDLHCCNYCHLPRWFFIQVSVIHNNIFHHKLLTKEGEVSANGWTHPSPMTIFVHLFISNVIRKVTIWHYISYLEQAQSFLDLHLHPGLKSCLPQDIDADPSKIVLHPASFLIIRLNLNLNRIICNYPIKPQPIISKTFLKLFVFSW